MGLWGILWRHEKISKKNIYMRFLNSVTVPKNVKGGTLCNFLTSIVLQNIETNEGETLWCNPKSFRKKSPSVEKKWGWGGILCVFSRLWTSVLFFFLFVLVALRRLELLRFEVVEVWGCWTNEQTSGPYALKNYPLWESGIFSTKMRRLKTIRPIMAWCEV